MANAGLDKLAHLIKIWISNANQRLLFLDQEIEEKSGSSDFLTSVGKRVQEVYSPTLW